MDPTTQDTPIDISQIAHDLVLDAHQHNYRALAVLAMVLLGWFIRTVMIRPKMTTWKTIGPALAWLKNNKIGHMVTLLVLGIIGGLLTVLKTGDKITIDILVQGLVNGALASGFVAAIRHYISDEAGTPDEPTVMGRPKPEPAKADPAMPPPLPPPPSDPGTGSKVASILILMALPSLIGGCACWTPEKAGTKACVVARSEVDCTKADIQALIPSMLPLVAWLFAGAKGQVPGDQVVQALEHAGFRFIGCSAAQLEQDFTINPTAAVGRLMASMPASSSLGAALASAPPSSTAMNYHENYGKWRSRHSDIKFCFLEGGLKVCR